MHRTNTSIFSKTSSIDIVAPPVPKFYDSHPSAVVAAGFQKYVWKGHGPLPSPPTDFALDLSFKKVPLPVCLCFLNWQF